MQNHRTATSLLALLLIAVLATAACTSAGVAAPIGNKSTAPGRTTAELAPIELTDAPPAGPNSAAEAPATEAPAAAISAAEILATGLVLEAHDMAVEDSGVQMRVERIVHRPDATLVRLTIVNGSEDDKLVPHQEIATMTLPDGSARQPVAAFPARGVQLASGESSTVVLTYTPMSGPFDLEIGIDGQATSQFSPLVNFQFDGLDATTVLPERQADAAFVAVGTHPNGTQIELDGIRFTPDRIGIGIDVRNGADNDLWLFGAADTFLEDDLGNRYRALVEPNGNTFFELPEQSSLSGVLSFAGRFDPRASSFSIVVNDGGLLTNVFAKSPAFVLGPFELGAAQATEVPVDVDVDVTIDRVNGSTGTLSNFSFDEDTIRAQVSIVNEGDEEADFNAGLTYVVDSEGITYQLQIADLPELVLSPGQGFEGELVFSGRLQPTATSLRLTINHGGGQQDSFFFDSVKVARSVRSVGLSNFEVDSTSRFVIAPLDTSSVSEIAGAMAQFDGAEVEGGVLLTLPESILFDFAASTLRPDAEQSIGLVSEILAYYEGEQVNIVGHTDSIGDDASNLALSIARADAVLNALIDEGADPDLLSIEGRGESEPLVANEQADGSDDPAGRQLNRRVEIFIETDRGIPQG